MTEKGESLMGRRLLFSVCAVFFLFAVLLTVSCGKPIARRSGAGEGRSVTGGEGRRCKSMKALLVRGSLDISRFPLESEG